LSSSKLHEQMILEFFPGEHINATSRSFNTDYQAGGLFPMRKKQQSVLLIHTGCFESSS
jgi:hypothetical protein